MAIEVQNRTHNNFLKTIEDKSKQKVTQFWDRQTVTDSKFDKESKSSNHEFSGVRPTREIERQGILIQDTDKNK